MAIKKFSIKEFSTLTRDLELETHHQMQFNILRSTALSYLYFDGGGVF